MARQPILPEYGTLNPPASPPEVTEEFDGVRWKCLKIVDGDKAIDPTTSASAACLPIPIAWLVPGIEDPVIFQALKKLLRCGRKHKAKAADVREAITSLERWEAMNREDARWTHNHQPENPWRKYRAWRLERPVSRPRAAGHGHRHVPPRLEGGSSIKSVTGAETTIFPSIGPSSWLCAMLSGASALRSVVPAEVQ